MEPQSTTTRALLEQATVWPSRKGILSQASLYDLVGNADIYGVSSWACTSISTMASVSFLISRINCECHESIEHAVELIRAAKASKAGTFLRVAEPLTRNKEDGLPEPLRKLARDSRFSLQSWATRRTCKARGHIMGCLGIAQLSPTDAGSESNNNNNGNNNNRTSVILTTMALVEAIAMSCSAPYTVGHVNKAFMSLDSEEHIDAHDPPRSMMAEDMVDAVETLYKSHGMMSILLTDCHMESMNPSQMALAARLVRAGASVIVNAPHEIPDQEAKAAEHFGLPRYCVAKARCKGSQTWAWKVVPSMEIVSTTVDMIEADRQFERVVQHSPKHTSLCNNEKDDVGLLVRRVYDLRDRLLV
ncbi:hypothetical protein ml_462 [Mollivirus sibericum]|uniref:hypothetical protein n=1 Tax=Mollivirus sibericum TaxID=1678078 RepID=UPI0006B2DA4F|nr:hypothetical protein ml_462 [Mollivirus sibericum]ALD62264.1 hypothetical protein ml_462 [Mollivirus sibericum]